MFIVQYITDFWNDAMRKLLHQIGNGILCPVQNVSTVK